jgi:hypothetical protein
MTDTSLQIKTSETHENDNADEETRESENGDDGSKFKVSYY